MPVLMELMGMFQIDKPAVHEQQLATRMKLTVEVQEAMYDH